MPPTRAAANRAHLRPGPENELQRLLLLAKVQFGRGRRDQLGDRLRSEAPNQGASHQPAVTRDPNALSRDLIHGYDWLAGRPAPSPVASSVLLGRGHTPPCPSPNLRS